MLNKKKFKNQIREIELSCHLNSNTRNVRKHLTGSVLYIKTMMITILSKKRLLMFINLMDVLSKVITTQ